MRSLRLSEGLGREVARRMQLYVKKTSATSWAHYLCRFFNTLVGCVNLLLLLGATLGTHFVDVSGQKEDAEKIRLICEI